MPLSDTKIHHTELLLTLDYLLRYTDENHPATQQDICRHATTFGLKYDPKNQKGNDVKRQRIGECLKFLNDVTEKYPDVVPFVLQRTDSGKYYIEQKYYLDEEQVIKILAAVKNDKYTQDEDTGFLIDRLLDSLSSVPNRNRFKKELKNYDRGVKKYNSDTNRKMRLVNKAFNENKMLKIRYEIYGKLNGINIYDFWYRVYKIKDYGGKPYAVLIPIDTGNIHFYQNYICEPIENLNIPRGSEKQVLCDDFDPKRDLNAWFEKQWKAIKVYYRSPEEIFDKAKKPVSGIPIKVSFYFRKALLNLVKPSFEEYFSAKMTYEECVSYDVVDDPKVRNRNNNDFYIVPHPLNDGEKPIFCVVNTFIDRAAFVGWLLSNNPGGSGVIFNLVYVVGRDDINRSIYEYYVSQVNRFKNRLDAETVRIINSKYN